MKLARESVSKIIACQTSVRAAATQSSLLIRKTLFHILQPIFTFLPDFLLLVPSFLGGVHQSLLVLIEMIARLCNGKAILDRCCICKDRTLVSHINSPNDNLPSILHIPDREFPSRSCSSFLDFFGFCRDFSLSFVFFFLSL